MTALADTPSDVVPPFHNRTPLILPREEFDRWLGFDTSVVELLTLLKPYPAGETEAYRVNNLAGDGPECVAPAAEPATLF